MKAQCYESGGRILLGDNTDGGKVIFAANSVALCWCLGFSWTLLCIHVHLTIFIPSFDLRRIFWLVTVIREKMFRWLRTGKSVSLL